MHGRTVEPGSSGVKWWSRSGSPQYDPDRDVRGCARRRTDAETADWAGDQSSSGLNCTLTRRMEGDWTLSETASTPGTAAILFIALPSTH